MRGPARVVMLFLSLALLAGSVMPAAARNYEDGAFTMQLVERGAKYNDYTLPVGSRLSQVTLSDRVFSEEKAGFAAVGMRCSFSVSMSDLPYGNPANGVIRMTGFMTGDDRELFYFYGTFDLDVPNGARQGVTTVHGLVVGDQDTMYMTGIAPLHSRQPSTERHFLLRATGRFENLSTDLPSVPVVGNAKIMFVDAEGRNVQSDITATADHAGTQLPVTILLDTTFNQVSSTLGSDDFTIDSGTTAVLYDDLVYIGSAAGSSTDAVPGSLTFTWEPFILTSGNAAGRGLSFGRFIFKPTAGGHIEGLIVADVNGANSGLLRPAGSVDAKYDGDGDGDDLLPVWGYIFGAATTGPEEDFMFGNISGTFSATADSFTGIVNAGIYQAESSPPEFIRLGFGSLSTQNFSQLTADTRDMNGSSDLRQIYLLINEAPTAGRIMARYSVDKKRLYLFDGRIGQWVGGCRPGDAGVIVKTPWARLSCEQTTVEKVGELVRVNWSLKPAAKMIGEWNVYGQATDRSGQIAGWKILHDHFDITDVP